MATPNLADAVYDAALAKLATCVRVSACTAEPANYAGIAAVSVGNYTLTAGAGNGDWVLANGDVSGRKLSLTAQSGNNGTATGAASYLAFDDGSVLLAVVSGSGQTVNNGSPWTLGAFDVVEMKDPVNE
jgi:hypothetical protein